MNCKQGELAVIKRGLHRGLVECMKAIPQPLDAIEITGGWWEIRTVGWVYPGNTRNLPVSYPDAWLRPIRDPGEDARDETLDWLPVPTKEIA